MKVLIPILLVTLLPTTCSAQPLPTRASCQVVAKATNGNTLIGSGICIYKDTTNVSILTTAHTFSDAVQTPVQYCEGGFCRSTIYYKAKVGTLHGWYDGWVTRYSFKYDLAIISLRLNDTTPFSVVKIPIGNKVPANTTLTITDCSSTDFRLITTTSFGDGKRVNTPVRQGVSGAGLCQGDYLVGLIWGTDFQTTSDYINLVTIKLFLGTPLSIFTPQGKVTVPNPQYQAPPKVVTTPSVTLPEQPKDGPKDQAKDSPKDQPKDSPKAQKSFELLREHVTTQFNGLKDDLRKDLPTKTDLTTSTDKQEQIIRKIDTVTSIVSGVSTVVGYAVPGVGLIGVGAGILGFLAKGAVNRRAQRLNANPIATPTDYDTLRNAQTKFDNNDVRIQPQLPPDYQQDGKIEYRAFPVHTQHPPSPPVIHTETVTVPVEVDNTSRAFAYAKQQIAVNSPGALQTLETVESIMKQFMAGQNLQK